MRQVQRNVKSRFHNKNKKSFQNTQEPNRQNQLEKKKFIAYFHLFAIFTLKLAGKYSNKRWNIIMQLSELRKKVLISWIWRLDCITTKDKICFPARHHAKVVLTFAALCWATLRILTHKNRNYALWGCTRLNIVWHLPEGFWQGKS